MPAMMPLRRCAMLSLPAMQRRYYAAFRIFEPPFHATPDISYAL